MGQAGYTHDGLFASGIDVPSGEVVTILPAQEYRQYAHFSVITDSVQVFLGIGAVDAAVNQGVPITSRLPYEMVVDRQLTGAKVTAIAQGAASVRLCYAVDPSPVT